MAIGLALAGRRSRAALERSVPTPGKGVAGVLAESPGPGPDSPGGDPFDRFPIDPIGTGIVVAILLVATALLVVGPLSTGLDASPAPPESEWNHVRVNDTHVQVAYVGGDEIDSDRLDVTVDGEARDPDWPATVTEGTVVVIPAQPERTVEIYWTGDERQRLARFSV